MIPCQSEDKNVLGSLLHYSLFEERAFISGDLKFHWIILLLSCLLNALPDCYCINFHCVLIVMYSFRKVKIIGVLISIQIGSSFQMPYLPHIKVSALPHLGVFHF